MRSALHANRGRGTRRTNAERIVRRKIPAADYVFHAGLSFVRATAGSRQHENFPRADRRRTALASHRANGRTERGTRFLSRHRLAANVLLERQERRFATSRRTGNRYRFSAQWRIAPRRDDALARPGGDLRNVALGFREILLRPERQSR